MPEESRFYVARSYASGIFAIAVMLVLAAIVVVAFVYGASPRALRPVVIIGEPDIFPVDPDGDGFQAPDRPTDDSPMILVRRPSSYEKMAEAERAVTNSVYHLKVPRVDDGSYRSGGSGFFVAPDTLATAAHVIPEDCDDCAVIVFCVGREDGLAGSVRGEVTAIDRERDVALIAVEGCHDAEPVTLTEDALDPNEMLRAIGYSLGVNIGVVDADHSTCAYIPGADLAAGIENRGSSEDWIRLVSPHLVGITGVVRCGNSGGAVMRSGDGAVVGMIVAREPHLARSFMAPASSIREMLERHGR